MPAHLWLTSSASTQGEYKRLHHTFILRRFQFLSLFFFFFLSDMQWPTAGTVGHMHAYGGGEGRTVLDCGQACKHLSGDIRPHTSKATPSQRAQLTESHIGPGRSDKLMRSFSFLCKPHLSTLWVFRCLLDEDNT